MQWTATWNAGGGGGGGGGENTSSLKAALAARHRLAVANHLARSHIGMGPRSKAQLAAREAAADAVVAAAAAAEQADADADADAVAGAAGRRHLQHHHRWGDECNCSAAGANYSAHHVGRAATPYPPGLGYWYSTPAQGECPEAAALGTNGCKFKRLPQAAISFGSDLTAAGFVRPVGTAVMGQNLLTQVRCLFGPCYAVPWRHTDSHMLAPPASASPPACMLVSCWRLGIPRSAVLCCAVLFC
eukprot:SAG22_NODE_222_length_14768_cov_6.358920_6_plen_244_part_00